MVNMDGPCTVETFLHKLSAYVYASAANHKKFYIGIAGYDGHHSAEKAVQSRGIGTSSHHIDKTKRTAPEKIFFTTKKSKEQGCKIEKELIKKYKDNSRCLNSILGTDHCSNYREVVVYCRIY